MPTYYNRYGYTYNKVLRRLCARKDAPSIAFIFLIITRSQVLLVDNFYFTTHTKYYSIGHKYNEEKNNNQKEIDKILDKRSKKGIYSLNKKENEKLKQGSKLSV